MTQPIEPSMSSNTEDLRTRDYRQYVSWQLVALLRGLKVIEALTPIQIKLVEAKADTMAATIKEDIQAHDSTLKAEYEEKVRQARIDELQRLIPNPVAEMASINYEDELKRLYDDLRERIAELNTPKNGEQDAN